MIIKPAMVLLEGESSELDHRQEFKKDQVFAELEGGDTPVQTRPLVSALRHEQVNDELRAQRHQRTEEELRHKEQMLVVESRTAIMAEMIANLAHQLRQPLNVMGLFAQDLELSYQAGKLTAEYLEMRVTQILHAIGEMSKTIDHLNNFSSPGKGKKIFHISEPIRWALSILDVPLKAANIKVSVNAAIDPVITGYPTEMAQVVIGIIGYARNALVERGISNPSISIVTSTEGGRKLVTVTDNVGAIPGDIVETILAPSSTTPDETTGVGLYAAKIIMERMNGSLTVRNVAGGAQFRILL